MTDYKKCSTCGAAIRGDGSTVQCATCIHIEAIAEQAKGQAAPVLAVKMPKPYFVQHGIAGDIDFYTAEQVQACAEEARREVLEEVEAKRLEIYVQGVEDGKVVAQKLAAAQRTAGGDAALLRSISQAMISKFLELRTYGEHDFGDEDMQAGIMSNTGSEWLVSRTEVCNEVHGVMAKFHRPVAEAAAQADDAGITEFMAEQFRAAPTAQPTPQQWVVASADYSQGQWWSGNAALPKGKNGVYPRPLEEDEGLVRSMMLSQAIFSREKGTAQPTPPDDERASPTFMDERQAQDWAWKAVRKDCGAGTWTTGESGNYFGFFLHGWRYREQYEKQRRAALRQPGALPDGADDAAWLHKTIANDVRWACMNLYSPDDSATDWTDKMAVLALEPIIDAARAAAATKEK